MSDFVIRKAERKGVPPLICLWSGSGGGKTYTALHIARGYVGPKGKIGLIDTENRRSEFYAKLVDGWDHLDLQPPFSPERYSAAFRAFETAGGYDAVIVDSMSHCWMGEGGVLDMAQRNKAPGLSKWADPKLSYGRMINTLLRAPFLVIFCIRAKNGIQQIGRGKDATIENIGLRPIIGEGMVFEMTVSALLGQDHCPAFQDEKTITRCDPLIPALKAPEDLKHIFVKDQPLGIETGRMIREWVDGAGKYDIDTAMLERDARAAAMSGGEVYKAYWISLSKEQKAALVPIHEELKAIAQSADDIAAGQLNNQELTGSDQPFQPSQSSAAPGEINSVEDARNAMQAAQDEETLTKLWDKFPIEICRALGAAELERQKTRVCIRLASITRLGDMR